MMHVRIAATTVIVFSFVTATDFSALAAPAKCNAELRKCNSHCSLVYESKPGQSHLPQPLQGQFLRLQGAAQLTRCTFNNRARRGF